MSISEYQICPIRKKFLKNKILGHVFHNYNLGIECLNCHSMISVTLKGMNLHN